MKVWDVLSGGNLVHTLSNHQKTITSLAFNGSNTRILSGSLDQQVKIYDVESYKVTHSVKYSAPILSVAISVCLKENSIFYKSEFIIIFPFVMYTFVYTYILPANSSLLFFPPMCL